MGVLFSNSNKSRPFLNTQYSRLLLILTALKNFHLRPTLLRTDVNPREYNFELKRCSNVMFVQVPNIDKKSVNVFSDQKTIV
jgi:hypothetical protein